MRGARCHTCRPPATLAPGETVPGTAHFRPRDLGKQDGLATMPVSDGAAGILAMTGLAIGAVIDVKPKSLFLGPAALETTRSGSVTVTNVGLDPGSSTPLVLSDVHIDGNDGAWQVTQSASSVGEPGASASIGVSFTPTAAGVSNAVLVLQSNDGMHPSVAVPLAAMGRALQPCTLAVSPGNPVDFGPQKLFQQTVQGFEVTNTTADDCIVGDHGLASGAPAGRTLPPGGRMSVRVEFVAQAAQSYSGSVQFYVSNKSAPSLTVGLTGSGDDSCFFISPTTVDFGSTTLGCGIGNHNLYAVNQCNYWVRVVDVHTSGAPFTTSAQVPIDVGPQSSAPIPIGYAP